MRIARRLTLMAAMAVAVLALAASSASAVEVGTEVADPSTAVTHCSAVAAATHGAGSGGCIIHASSVGQVELGTIFGHIARCDNEFEGRTNEAGTGYIYSRAFTNCDFQVTDCVEAAGEDTWALRLTSTTNMEAVFCVVVAGIQTACHISTISVAVEPAHNDATFSTNGNKFCEGNITRLSGTWEAEVDAAHPEVEIR